MKYVMAFGPVSAHGKRALDDGSTRETLSEECRDAALAFMSGVAIGWDKLDLALWLTGPYARATRHATHGERVTDLTGTAEISDEAIEDLVTRVRGQLIASLEQAALDFGMLDFAHAVVERGLVRKVVDAEGRDAWLPVDGTNLRLRDRIEALFTADYLNAPYAYAELFVCHRCEAIVYDAISKRRGLCGSHRVSGVVVRQGAPANVDDIASNDG